MEDDTVWDFYLCRIDDSPGSIFFNDSVKARAPLPGHDMLVVLSVRMQMPRDDGLSSSEEFDALLELEKRMEEMLAPPKAFYVGRATHAGLRDLYFYTTDADKLVSLIDKAMREFSDYEYATPVENDADWRIYSEFLYPSPRDRQRIENRKVCDLLERDGDDLTTEREIAHWAYFLDAESRDEFVLSTAKLGYELREKFEPDEVQSKYGACVLRNDPAIWEKINEVTLELFDLAIALGGDYDGWESPVERR